MKRLYAAIDLHSNNGVLVIIDETDRVLYERRLPNDLRVVLGELAPYAHEVTAIAVESTFNWYWLVDGLMEAGYEVKLVNTVAVKVYEGRKFTGDKHDARHLAHLLRLGILPTGYIYPKAERAVRDLLRKRLQLVRCRTLQILSMESWVNRHTGQGISSKALRGLSDDALGAMAGNPYGVMGMQSNRTVMKCLDGEIEKVEGMVLKQAKLQPVFEKLLTVNGIGPILGMTIMYETGPIDRFKHVGHFASYARCVGSRRESNGKKKGEGNRKNGNKYLCWAFVEATHHAVRSNERIRRFYERKKAKRNGIVAVKTVAHKLARACYHVLKDQVPFDAARAFSG
jgi:transposase